MRSSAHRPAKQPARTRTVVQPALRAGTLLIIMAMAAMGGTGSTTEPEAAIVFLPGAFLQGDQDSIPVAKGYRIVQPGTKVADLSFLEFYSYWNVPAHASAYSVTADLSALDAAATAPLRGTYLGDTAIVVGSETTDRWGMYRFTWRMSASGQIEDGAAIPVPITAFDSLYATETTDEALRFCLSNHPPAHVATQILGDSARFIDHEGELYYNVRNGDRIEMTSTWRYRAGSLSLTADFSAADDAFDLADVFAWPISWAGDSLVTWRIEYTLDEEAFQGSDYPVPIRITAADGGCGRDSVIIAIEIDNDGPAGAPLFASEIPPSTGESELIVYGTAPEGSADLLVVINQSIEQVLDLFPAGNTLQFYDTLQLETGTNHIVAYGRDFIGNRSEPSEEYLLTREGAPQFKRCVVSWPTPGVVTADTSATQPEFAVRNGDTIVFYCYWDSRAPYEILADFSALDSQAGAGVWGVPCESLDSVRVGGGYETWNCYQFEYTISENNLLVDSDEIVIPITAYDPVTQFRTTTRAVRFCLNNHPPEHVMTKVISPGVFNVRNGDTLWLVRNGGQVILHSYWRSTDNLFVRADLSDLDASFEFQRVERSKIDSLSTDSLRVYQIKYRFGVNACCEPGQDPYPLYGRAYVWNTACGSDTSAAILFEMDNQGPQGGPILAAGGAPDQTSAASITLNGSVPSDAAGVSAEILTETLDDPVLVEGEVDPDEPTFSITLPLEPGENVVTLYAQDLLGNRSTEDIDLRIFRVAGTTYSIPKPFAPGDEFVLARLEGWDTVALEIFNLEGERVQSWSHTGSPLFIVRQEWDGRNGDGAGVRRGPYFLRIRTRAAGSGVEHEEVRAFVFTR